MAWTGEAIGFAQSASDAEIAGIGSGGVRGALAGRAVDGTAERLLLGNRTPSYWMPFISMQTISCGSPVLALTRKRKINALSIDHSIIRNRR